jgi:regulator of sigma E protease
MHGEGDMDGGLEKDPESFSSKPVWQRMIIAAAGVIMNFLLAFVLLFLLFVSGYQKPLSIIPDALYPLSSPSYILSSESFAKEQGIIALDTTTSHHLFITHASKGTIADSIHIPDGVRVLSLQNTPIYSGTDFKKYFSALPRDTKATLEVELQDKTKKLFTFTKTSDLLGVELKDEIPYTLTGKTIRMNVLDAAKASAQEVLLQTTYTFHALGSVFGKIFSSLALPEEIGGPVQIASTISAASKVGFDALLFLAILISINLGVFNILPIPALDGGRIFFMIYELLFRKKANQNIEVRIHLVGYAFLLILILLVTYQDIIRLIKG